MIQIFTFIVVQIFAFTALKWFPNGVKKLLPRYPWMYSFIIIIITATLLSKSPRFLSNSASTMLEAQKFLVAIMSFTRKLYFGLCEGPLYPSNTGPVDVTF